MMMTMNYFSIQFVNSCMQRSEGVRSSQIFIQFYSLHDYCEHLIAPGTLGHIAQKTLHLAATNCTTGEHHNTNFFPMHPPNPFRPGGPKNPGRVTLASRRPERQSPIRTQQLPNRNQPIRKIRISGDIGLRPKILNLLLLLILKNFQGGRVIL